jgi:hypothetical protein
MKILFHIGLPKAASSSLQVGLSACADIVFLGLYPTQNVAEGLNTAKDPHKEIPYFDDPRIKEFYLAFSLKDYSTRMQSDLYAAICSDYANDDKTLFFSYEGFTSPMFSEVTPYIKLQRLVECCSNATFLFITRNQGDVIKSQYRDWPFDLTVTGGRALNLNQWCWNELQRADCMGPVMWFDFQRLLEPLKEIVLVGRLHVLLFEDFIEDRGQFYVGLSKLLGTNAETVKSCLYGVRANQGVSARYNAYRKLRRLVPASFSIRSILPEWLIKVIFRFLNRGGAEQLNFDLELKKKLEELFKTSNRDVAKQLKLSFDGKGYWV